jgi:hypothetical protein
MSCRRTPGEENLQEGSWMISHVRLICEELGFGSANMIRELFAMILRI